VAATEARIPQRTKAAPAGRRHITPKGEPQMTLEPSVLDAPHAGRPQAIITTDSVHTALYAVWGHQACQHPDEWPEVFARLMLDGGSGENKRGSLKLRYEAAISALADAYRDGPPADGPDLIRRAFPLLDRDHRVELHRRLGGASRR
jgi:hypothetical protein